MVGVCAPIILDPDKRVNGSDRSVAMAGSGSPDCLRTMAGSAEPYAATSIDLALHRPDFAGATALLDIPEANSRVDAAKAGLKVMRLGDAMLYIAQRQIQYALTDEPIIDRLLDRTIYFPNDPSILDYPVDGISSERVPIMSPGDNGVPEIHLVDSRPADATVVPALKVRVSAKELRLAS